MIKKIPLDIKTSFTLRLIEVDMYSYKRSFSNNRYFSLTKILFFFDYYQYSFISNAFVNDLFIN